MLKRLLGCVREFKKPTILTLIPYNAFANRGESDMLVWFHVQA